MFSLRNKKSNLWIIVNTSSYPELCEILPFLDHAVSFFSKLMSIEKNGKNDNGGVAPWKWSYLSGRN